MASHHASAQVTVPGAPATAFTAFTEDFGRWWPRAYTWSQEGLERIALGSAAGELCTEVGPHGFRCDWGRVLAVDAPQRLVLAWQIGPTRVPEPDPQRASEVRVTFEVDGAPLASTLLNEVREAPAAVVLRAPRRLGAVPRA